MLLNQTNQAKIKDHWLGQFGEQNQYKSLLAH